MTKLISGRVAKVSSANVSADRYEFLDVSQAEPDLGLPPVSGWVLAANTNGTRFWVDPVSATAGAAQFAYTAGSANVSLLANVANTVLTISNFSTANLIEGINLYFTNARVVSAVTPLLTTANVIETSGNLYFTTARVNATVQPFLTTANVIETSGNLYFTAARVNATVQPFLTTANVRETSGNLYFTNVRVVSALIAGQNIIIESNGRISANVSSVSLTTDQVPEGVNNKYFTNARVLVGVTTGTIAGSLNLTGNITGANNIIVGSGAGGYISGVQALHSNAIYANSITVGSEIGGYISGVQAIYSNIIYANSLIINGNEVFSNEQGANLTVTRIFTNSITSNTWNGLYTANVIETANNLYFTNARVVSALIAGQNITIEANGRISANASSGASLNLTTADVRETSNLYFTNARVVTAVTPLLTTANVIESSSNLYFTTSRVNATVQPFLTTANVIETSGNLYFTNARVVVAVTPLLTTANVIETGSNLYFTNARVVVAVTPLLTTSNVSEGSNLYFTNARVLTGITTGVVLGNIVASGDIVAYGNLIANGLIIRNIAVSDAVLTGNVSASGFAGNTITVDIVTANIWNGLYTANVIESPTKLFFTNARVISAVTPLLTTSNVIEGSNLYFTAARVNATVQPFLTTANVIETSGNLYFTNARVVSALIAGQNIVIEANGRISANSTSVASLNLTTADVRETSNLYFTNGRVITAVTPILTTSNVIEGTNQYFTNARVLVGITTGTVVGNISTTGKITADILAANSINVGSGAGGSITDANLISAIYIQANTWLGLYTANVVESLTNLYFTNARVIPAVTPLLTTANVIESTNNLYYTNSRVRSAINGGTGVTVNSSTGEISIGQDVSTTANVTFYNLSVTNNLVVYGGVERFLANNLVISDNMIYLNNNSINSNPDLGIAFNYNDGVYHHAGFFRDHSDGSFKVFDNYTPEPDANIFINTAHASFRLANLQATNYIGNVTGFVTGQVSSLDNFNTSALKEGANLYFTNSRVVSALIAGQNIIIEANGRISANINTTIANLQSQISNLSTDQISEGSVNLYYTNSRVASVVTPRLTTANVIETSGNLYFTNSRVVSALTAGDNIIIEANGRISANVSLSIANLQSQISGLTTDQIGEGNTNKYFTNAQVIIAVTPLLTTSNVAEGSNLYFTAARVNATVQPFLTTANVVETSSNLYFTAARVNATVQPFLTTANVIETSSNLYFTTARVNATVQPFLTTANVIETSGNLYFTPARTVIVVTPLLTTANVIETNTNLYYTNSRVRSTLSNSIGVYYNSSSGQFSIGQDVATTSNVIFANVSITGTINSNSLNSIGGDILVTGNILPSLDSTFSLGSFTNKWKDLYLYTTSLYLGNTKVASNADTGGLAVTSLSGASADLSTANLFATGLIYGDVVGRVSNLYNHTTSNLREGVNQYFTNVRVLQAVNSLLTTANVLELTNQYFTNVRVLQAVNPLLTTANVIETSNNLYFTNVRVLQAVNPLLTTANVIETSNNLYFTNVRVLQAVNPLLTTANVIETSNNLYFTNVRVVAALIAGQNIIIDANGRISANSTSVASLNLTTADVRETSNLYFTNSRVLVGITTGAVVGNITATGTITANILSANTLSIGTGTGGTISGFANITATGTITTNILSANTLSIGTGTGGAISGIANITATDTITANTLRANNIILQNINVTSNIITGTVSSGTSTSNIIVADSVTSNTWNRLYTANVIETSGNLYFTNARVVVAVTPFLTTANVVETANNNLYFTNARVLAGVATGTVTGNITATGIISANIVSANTITIGTGTGGTISGFANITATGTITTNILSANTLSIGTGTGGTIAGANLISATYIQGTNWLGLYTSNVVETSSNLYFTNARVVSALIAGQNITIEANGRISSAANSTATVTAVLPYLTTSNVAEGSNLYFTNSRVLTGITTGTVVGNITVTGIVTANILNANTLSIGAGAGGTLTGLANITATDTITANTLRANNIILQNINVTSNIITGTVSSGTSTSNIIVADSVTSNTWNRLYTANVIETSGNLYFTNARVLVGITTGTVVGNITATGTITANILSANTLSIGAGAGGTLTGIANIVVTNTVTTNIMSANTLSIGTGTGGTIAGANLISTTYIQATNWLGLYTANVVETANNLYFTNARVVSALVAGQNITIEANGRISSTANSTATVTAVLPYLTTSNVAEGSNLYFTTARVNATVQPFLTTANVVETANNNLYFTNARVLIGIATGTVVGNITATGTITANIISANVGIFGSGSGGSLLGANIISAGTISANLLLTNVLIANAAILGSGVGGSLTGANLLSTITIQANSWLGLYTANVVESPTNLYFTNARVNATVQPFLTTANVIETSGNLYFTNARVINALVNSNIQVQNLYANSTIYANTIVLQNINVTSNIITGTVSSGTSTSNIILADSVTSNTWNRLYTANVIETSGNLYFTNTRVVSALIAGENITILANGRISASSILPISVINDSYRFISTGNTTYNIGTSVNDPKNVLVIVEGLIQLPVVDYTVSSTSLIFTEAPTNGTNVEVRFFGIDTINSGRALTSDINAFIGNGSNVNYTLSSTPPNKNFVSIIIDGVYQQSDSYTLSNKTITLSEAPAIGANIDIRVIGGIAGSSYNTRTFTGNGTSNTFALTEGFNKDTVLVFENGVAQMPTIDYDIVNDSLVFTTPPAANIVVQVRELGIPSLAAANVLASIRGLDQTVGNLVPTVGVSKNLGSSASPFNQLYLSSNVVLSGAGTTLYITGGGTTQQVATAASVSAKILGYNLVFGG